MYLTVYEHSFVDFATFSVVDLEQVVALVMFFDIRVLDFDLDRAVL